MIRTQEDQWSQVAQQLASVTDSLGMPIDEGIRETVIALNALGIHTIASCEGHLDRGIAAPWVDIAAPNVRELEKAAFLKQRAVEQARLAGVPPEGRQELMREAEQAKLEVKRLHVQERMKLVCYLDAFYRERHADYDRRLILVMDWSGGSRLQSQGADCQDVRTQEERARNLSAYREEMQAFTVFLRRMFDDRRGSISGSVAGGKG